MEDPVDAVDDRGEGVLVRHVRLHEAHVRVAAQMGEVLGPARGEIVDGEHVEALSDEPIDQVTADEAGSARHHGLHAPPPHLIWSIVLQAPADAGAKGTDGEVASHPARVEETP